MHAYEFRQIAAFAVIAFALTACSRNRAPSTSPGSLPSPVASGPAAERVADPTVVYNQMGLIATGNPLAYVGKIAYFAAPTPDTTIMLASISIPNRMLSFIRDGDTYRAPYEVKLRITRGGVEVKSVETMEIVRVASFKEVNRTDESIIFQNYFRLPPGDYAVSFMVRDISSNRSATQEGAITVLRWSQGALWTQFLVYEACGGSRLDSVTRIF